MPQEVMGPGARQDKRKFFFSSRALIHTWEKETLPLREKLSAEQSYYDYYRASQFSRTSTYNMAYNIINSIRLELLSENNYDTWRIQAEALLIKNDT